MLSVILDIILIILKFIGISLLVILGLLLAILLIVLFVPIRYKSAGAGGKYDDGLKINVSAKITWLLHIIAISFVFKDKVPELKVKIFGFDIMSKKKKAIKDNHMTFEDDTSTQINSDESLSEDINVRTEKVAWEEKTTIDVSASNSTVKAVTVKEQSANLDSEEEIKENKGLKHKIKHIFDKIKGLCVKIKNVNDVKNSFIAYLKKDESKKAIKEIKNIIFKVLLHILPQKFKAKVRFGFEDPSTTGNILGILSIFYGVYGNKLELEPDFDNQVFEGEYKLKGRIRVVTLLRALWKLYRNKWIRDFISFSKKSVQDI